MRWVLSEMGVLMTSSGSNADMHGFRDALLKSLGSAGVRKKAIYDAFVYFIFAAIYLASFTDIFLTIFERLPYFMETFLIALVPATEEISQEMIAHGDEDLATKHLTFNILNFYAVFIFSFLLLFFPKVQNKDVLQKYRFKSLIKFFLFMMAVFWILMLINAAGYEETSVFPRRPKPGQGEFYFIRETFCYGMLFYLVSHVVVIVRFKLVKVFKGSRND